MLVINKIQPSEVLQHPIAKSHIISGHAAEQLDPVMFELCRFIYLSLRPSLPSGIDILRTFCRFHRWVQVDEMTVGGS